jgi:hydroxymethylglutaryl-CoA reductase (NADPH)
MPHSDYETPVPTKWVGPFTIHSETGTYSVHVPLATYETPLWPSVKRGARVANASGGMTVTILKNSMSRSILIEAPSARKAAEIQRLLEIRKDEIFIVAKKTSRFFKPQDLFFHQVGTLLYIRLSGTTGDASGHNMVTKAQDAVLQWICNNIEDVTPVSVSGNWCTDKKVSSVNALLGRGKYVIAECTLSPELCDTYLRTTPQKIVDLNIKKNLVGSIINGGVQSANAHVANMLLALYIATGQDAANIIEGSQSITYAEVVTKTGALYFSVTLPNIIIGTVGGMKQLPHFKEAFEKMGCSPTEVPGNSSLRFAECTAACVLAGELSLLAAQTNPGELVRSHLALERRN